MQLNDPHGDIAYLRAAIENALFEVNIPELASVFGWFSNDGIVLHYYLKRQANIDSMEKMRIVSSEVISSFERFRMEELFSLQKPEDTRCVVEVFPNSI